MLSTSGLLAGKVVVVSGVGPALGRSIALQSAAAGASVVLAARTRERLESVATEIRDRGGIALAVPTDLTDVDSIEALAQTALDEFGAVDCLVNNAFVQPAQVPLLDADLASIQSGIDINLLAALNVTRALVPALTASQGSIVMVTSMVLRNQLPGFGAYRIMKAGLLAMARSLSIDLGPKGIRVNSVAPGYIWADSVKNFFDKKAAADGVDPKVIYDEIAAGTDLRRLPEPDDIANAVVFLLSDSARAIAGQCLDVNCGHTHH
ncbi:SDR family oxidoreductase [Rhodococcus sp. OK302]|uniref:SDR family oxidoreductase n=1 Tax=Rhodococcus sp. OK302 TaxID=1882769 RepID=UPI000B944ECE|nr:SDR family oxidoreductase [Rhodococcus sp. OK302]OYD68765.1 NAD(P)-dependent dehydrogenase (short-subunit alcohol dehydrogenase family) [Rhodococcus sp. OK302]